MFNSYNYKAGDQSVKINAVSGSILKNHPCSWFERFNLNSNRADALLKEGGYKATKKKYIESAFYRSGYETWVDTPDKDIIILQMMVCGDMEVIAECVYRSDYEHREEETT